MPELPEVEIYRRYFEANALRQKIRSVTVHDRGVLTAGTSATKLNTALPGRHFESVTRHGKNLFARISGNGWLRIHFGMTGDLVYFRDAAPRFARVVFHFSNGASLAYEDARKFGRLELIAAADEYVSSGRFGPDPLSANFQSRRFAQAVAGRRGAIKPMLLNQRIIAGVGNLYADEALFQAGVHPLARVEKLGQKRLTRLFSILQKILEKVIEVQASDERYPRTYLLPRRAVGAKCPRCGGSIQRTTVGGRTTYFCPRHQRK